MKGKGFAGLGGLKMRDATAPIYQNAALEASIEEEPDDAASYLVLADAMQTAGDPRGLLITLQANGADHQAHLQTHRAYFLGLLATHDGEYEVEWFMGYFRSLRLIVETTKDALALLDIVIALPSSRFLRELEIRRDAKLPIDTNALGARLAEHAKPVTLERFHIAERGWSVPDAIRQAFPRLGGPARELARALEVARRRSRLGVRLDIAACPALVAREPELAFDQTVVLRALEIELGRNEPIGALAAVQRAFTQESLRAVAHFLVGAWRTADAPEAEAWVQDLLAAVEPQPRAVDAGFGALGHAAAVEIIEELVRDGGDAAISALYMIAETHGLARPRRTVARHALEGIAKQRDLSVERLIDLTCPAAVPESLREAVDSAHRLWLHDLMESQRRIPADEFEHFVVRDPLRRRIAGSLVFTQRAQAGVRSFRIDAEGVLRGSDGVRCELGDRTVGVLHPADPEGVDLAAWREALAGEPPPAFPQLQRSLVSVADDEREGNTVRTTRFIRKRTPVGQLVEGLEGAGWDVNREYGTSTPSDAVKTIRLVDGTTVTATALLGHGGSVILQVEFPHRLGPVQSSELLYELDCAIAGMSMLTRSVADSIAIRHE